ncbi:unnamed protein product [Rotaria sordida]|uniref:Uncharacterized protein n=1 Tax=Rotaria sordida TaxID=392033 RepID=A0A814LMK1_9BILA|nr:unnamed protein product [Rotaria sordida]CAF1248395.1 unnamed protein product [Rotaria sordida]
MIFILTLFNYVNGYICYCYCPHYVGITNHYTCTTVECSLSCSWSYIGLCKTPSTIFGYCGMSSIIIPAKLNIFILVSMVIIIDQYLFN